MGLERVDNLSLKDIVLRLRSKFLSLDPEPYITHKIVATIGQNQLIHLGTIDETLPTAIEFDVLLDGDPTQGGQPLSCNTELLYSGLGGVTKIYPLSTRRIAIAYDQGNVYLQVFEAHSNEILSLSVRNYGTFKASEDFHIVDLSALSDNSVIVETDENDSVWYEFVWNVSFSATNPLDNGMFVGYGAEETRSLFIDSRRLTYIGTTQVGGSTPADYTMTVSYDDPGQVGWIHALDSGVRVDNWDSPFEPTENVFRRGRIVYHQLESPREDITIFITQQSQVRTTTYRLEVTSPTNFDLTPLGGSVVYTVVSKAQDTENGVVLSERNVPTDATQTDTSWFKLSHTNSGGTLIAEHNKTHSQKSTVLRVTQPDNPGSDGFSHIVTQGSGLYVMIFKTDTTTDLPSWIREFEAFLVGGGGAGSEGSSGIRSGAGGGGGYTSNYIKDSSRAGWTGTPITVNPGDKFRFYVGKGGDSWGARGETTAIYRNGGITPIAQAAGGYGGDRNGAKGGNGGSGGGAGDVWLGASAGSGGTNGGNSIGGNATAYGQVDTTYPFTYDGTWASGLTLDMYVNVPYAGGGAGWGPTGSTGTGGNYGGGDRNNIARANYGGGGGGSENTNAGLNPGASGCIIIRVGYSN